MTSFEELPENIRALLRIKLLTELNAEKCDNLLALARKRNGDVARVWRDICRKAGQSPCSIPVEIEKATNK